MMELAWKDILPDDFSRPATTALPGIQGVRVGLLAEASEAVLVSYADQPGGEPVAARTTIPLTPGDEGRSVLLVFEDGDAERPIITGFIQEQPVTTRLETDGLSEARIDGRRVRLEAEREILLQCGKSSVLLRADGKIVIRGVEIVSRARRANKVKGGTVKIN